MTQKLPRLITIGFPALLVCTMMFTVFAPLAIGFSMKPFISATSVVLGAGVKPLPIGVADVVESVGSVPCVNDVASV